MWKVFAAALGDGRGIDRNRSLYAIMGIKVGSQLWEKRAVPLTGNP